MTKVLHIAPTPFFSDRGCHIRIKGIVEGLDKLGVENIIATYHHGREIDGIRTARTLTIPGYNKLDAGPSPFKYLADILLFFKVLFLIGKERPDIIHGHLHEGVLVGWAANLFFFWRRTPLVFDMQGSLVGELEAHGYFEKFKLLKKVFWGVEFLITRLPAVFLCSSSESVRVLTTSFGIPSERVSLASDGADVLKVDEQQVFDLQSQLNLHADLPVVIYSGALSEAKGLGVLCKLIKAASERALNCQFLIVGYPVEDIQRYIKENDLNENCHLAGRVPFEALSVYLSCAQIAIEPKLANSAEASGKLLNYMGAGLAVLCFKTKNNIDILGDTGYYAADQNVDSLVKSLSKMLDNLHDAQEMGSSSRVRLLERFSWDRTAKIIHSKYMDCTKGQCTSMSVNKHKEDL